MNDDGLWSELHDAFLEKIEMDFGGGVVIMRLRLPTEAEAARLPIAGADPSAWQWPAPGPVRAVCTGFRHFSCPREHPWGPSRSVNDAQLTKQQTGLWMLRVEMQSGDVIEIHAEQMAISREG